MSQKDDCQPRMTAVCEETELQVAEDKGGCPVWTACLPFGGQLVSEGGCVNYTPGTPPPDGVYSKIVIANGCIVSAELADIPLYTSSPCAPVPVPCDCDGGSGSGLPDPSPTVGNLFKYDASGRPLVKVSVVGGTGISVTGTGTSDDPIVITNTQQQQGQQYFRSGNSFIELTGTGAANDPYTFTHVLRMSGTYNGMVFDEAGHLIDYNAPSGSTDVRGIVEGDGIKVDMNVATGIATISLADPTIIITGTYVLGGYELEFYRNRLIRITRLIERTAGDYLVRAADGGTYTLTYNDYGSLEDIVYSPAPSPDPTMTSTSASKRFTVATENTREMTITTDKSSAFRISYIEAAVPADILLFIDNIAIDGHKFPATAPHHFEAAPPALYAAGTHTIMLQSASGFSGVGILDLTLTTVQ